MGRPLEEIADCVAVDYCAETYRNVRPGERGVVRNAILDALGVSKEPSFIEKASDAQPYYRHILNRVAPVLFYLVCMTWAQYQFELSEG